MKRPKTFIGIWDDSNAYFPHLDGLSVMIFEHADLPADRGFIRSAGDIFSWVAFVWRHTDSQVVLTKEGN